MVDTSKSETRFALLDLLRLFAALMVLCFHWLFRGPAAGVQATDFPDAARLAVYGYIGVDWFFVISGFVIAWTAEGRSAITFAIMRFSRLYPGYIACMSITFLMTAAYQWSHFTPGWADWLANSTMFAPALGRPLMDGAYWSIIVEIVFYGWVFVALATGAWKHRVGISFLWLALSIANMAWLKSDALRFLLITDFAPWFIIGMMMFETWREGPRLETTVIGITAFLASCLSLAIQIPGFAHDYGVAPELVTLFSLNALGIVCIAAAIEFRDTGKAVSRICVLAGAISYPLYLFHQHAGYMMIDRLSSLAGAGAAFVFTLLAVFAVAVSTAMLIEKPLRPVIIRNLLALTEKLQTALHWPTNAEPK